MVLEVEILLSLAFEAREAEAHTKLEILDPFTFHAGPGRREGGGWNSSSGEGTIEGHGGGGRVAGLVVMWDCGRGQLG